MVESPGNIVPVSTVPESAKSECEGAIEYGAGHTMSVATKRNIDIVANPGAERNMPAVPEVANIQSQIRPIEIRRQNDSHHAGKTDGDV